MFMNNLALSCCRGVFKGMVWHIAWWASDEEEAEEDAEKDR
jgi:hypothetical protein